MLLISVRLTVLSGGRETPAEYRVAEVPSIMALLLNMHVCLFFLVAGGVERPRKAKLLAIKIAVEIHPRMKCEGIQNTFINSHSGEGKGNHISLKRRISSPVAISMKASTVFSSRHSACGAFLVVS